MGRNVGIGICAAAWMACMVAGRATLGADTGTTAPVVVQDDAYWQGLQDRLGSEDPKVRAGATKELEGMPWQSKSKLQALLESSKDEQVKASLEARIEGIAEQLATDPPPISVDLHDASLSEAVEALHKETGIAMTSWPPYENRQGTRYTLTAKDKSFWEVFTGLSAQHPLTVQRNDRFQIMQSEPGLLRLVPATSGFCVFPGAITRSRTADLQADAGEETGDEMLTMAYTVAADPRVKILSHGQPVLTEVVDDAGNELLTAVAPKKNRRNFMQGQLGEALFQGSSTLAIVDNMGKKIASAKGQANFVVQISEEVLTVDKPEEKLKQPMMLAGQTITINKFEVKEETIAFEFGNQAQNRGRRGGQLPTWVRVMDKANQQVWESQLYGGSSGSIGTQGFAGPFHVRFSTASKTKEVVVEFEMKDIAIP